MVLDITNFRYKVIFVLIFDYHKSLLEKNTDENLF